MSFSSVQPATTTRPPLRDAFGRPYEPAIGPRLRILLFIVFLATALLGVTGVYLTSIRILEWWRDPQTYTNSFTLWVFLVHILVGVAVLLPFLIFGITHYFSARQRKNRLAVRLGITLFLTGLLVVFSGVALIQLTGMPQLPSGTITRWVVYGLHVVAPVVAVALYVLHRRAGPDIQWRWGYAWGGIVAIFVGGMILLHLQDPRQWGAKGSRLGEKYFEPAATRTRGGKFIPAGALMMDEYCLKCHGDIYQDHLHSAHKFSSFSNPAYLFSVQETRVAGQKRDGNVQGSRWCAGCHDPAPFLSGSFEDPRDDPAFNAGSPRDKDRLALFLEVDDVLNGRKDARTSRISSAGISCVVCHGMTHVNSVKGNGDYTIEEPEHYPFAYHENPVLQWLNNQVVKARPDFHRKTFLKPFHKTAEFCSTCHKVSLPVELNHYKEFLRGQNHYDSFLLTGVSGGNARAFYAPPVARTNCAECHMPLRQSNDFGSKDFDGSGVRKVHNHLFPGGNTGLPFLLSLDSRHSPHAADFKEAAQKQADFLTGTDPDGKDRNLRIDLFGLKAGGDIGDLLIAPLRPRLPELEPGKTYLLEVVIRTLGLGHPFTQGTADSNEVWVDFMARAGSKIIGRSGALEKPDESGPVDAWAHRINVLMLDRNGNRINRRNPQDIFTPLYNHQIAPGAAQVVHYSFTVPAGLTQPIELEVRLRYRKFDFEYMTLVHGSADKVPKLPIVDLCSDRVVLPVKGVNQRVPEQKSPIKPAWQRWNDYGIGCLLEGGADENKGELRQAEQAFLKMLELKEEAALPHAHLNLTRVHFKEGRLKDAVADLNAAREARAPWWTVSWFSGLVNSENARNPQDWDAAIADFERILDPENQPRDRKFDFTRDYVVINKLGETLFHRSQLEDNPSQRDPFLHRAIEQYERTLKLDPENTVAHYGLKECFDRLSAAMVEVPRTARPQTDEATLVKLGEILADRRKPRKERLEAHHAVLEQVASLSGDLNQADRDHLKALLVQLQPALDQEDQPRGDTDLRDALIAVRNRLTHILRTNEDALLERSRILRDSRQARPNRLHATVRLAQAVEDLDTEPLWMKAPKRIRLELLLGQLRPYYHEETDPELKAGVALVLRQLHLAFHTMFKPDELARSRTVKLYRARHPAADHAAEAIVIYPLNRKGAPGF